MTDTAYEKKPAPTPLPAEEHTAEGLAEKLYDCYSAYAKTGEKHPAWKEADLSAKLRWRAVANLALSRGPFDDPDEHRRMAEDERWAFQHVRDMAFADANPKPKTKDDKDKDDKDTKDSKNPKDPPVGPPFPHK